MNFYALDMIWLVVLLKSLYSKLEYWPMDVTKGVIWYVFDICLMEDTKKALKPIIYLVILVYILKLCSKELIK